VKGRCKGGLVFLKDAKKTGAAAGEGGIECAGGMERFFYFVEFRVQTEQGCFEIVGEGTGPGLDGSADDILQGAGGFVGRAKGKGPCGTDVDAGVDEDE
jgi:hypothetical protein